VGLEPQSSQSHPPQLELQAWATSAWPPGYLKYIVYFTSGLFLPVKEYYLTFKKKSRIWQLYFGSCWVLVQYSSLERYILKSFLVQWNTDSKLHKSRWMC
jgi:hypothetical protein